jgi:hypothetical protein
MTSSPHTLIPFWKKSSTRGEKRKDILARDVSSRSFTKKVARFNKICKISQENILKCEKLMLAKIEQCKKENKN